MYGALVFIKKSRGEGSQVLGILKAFGNKYEVITGGFGLGALPNGIYKIKIRNAVEGNRTNMLPGLIDDLNPKRKGWFLPIEPKFTIIPHRDGFGIHPDGKPKGTKGCIGLIGKDAKKFFSKWNSISPISSRPKVLRVISELNN